MLILLATLLIGSYRPAAQPQLADISQRRAIFGSQLDAGHFSIQPNDNAWCLGMPRNWPGCNNGY